MRRSPIYKITLGGKDNSISARISQTERAILNAIVFLEINNDTFAASRLTSAIICITDNSRGYTLRYFSNTNHTYRRIYYRSSHVITLYAIHSLYIFNSGHCRTHASSAQHIENRLAIYDSPKATKQFYLTRAPA